MSNVYKSIKFAKDYLNIAANLNINLGFAGAHGRAKTSVVKQYANENGYELITIILSRLTPEDMIGLPVSESFNKQTVTAFSNPKWLVEACDKNKKVLLFFDEFNNAELDTQASILDLIESREANGLNLNDDTQIVMAFNPEDIAPSAKTLSMATRDRICVIPICDNSSYKSYLNYYEDKGYYALKETFYELTELVSNHDESVISCAYENAEFTYRSLEKSYLICKYCFDNDIDKEIAKEMVCGYAGAAGIAFTDSIFKNLKNAEISSLDYNDLITKYRKSFDDFERSFASRISKSNDFEQLVRFFNIAQDITTPVEFQKLLNNHTTKEFSARYFALQ